MTCIVAIKDDDNIYIGGDRQGSSGGFITHRNKPKVFTLNYGYQGKQGLNKQDAMLIGFTSSFRMGDILRHIFKAPDYQLGIGPEDYMVKFFVPELIKCFKKNEYIQKKDESISGGCFIVCLRGRIFTIEEDFQVGESIENYAAVGSGSEIALGAFYAMQNCNTSSSSEDKVRTALKAASHYNAYVDDIIDIIVIG